MTRVLIVDDEPDFAVLLSRQLGRATGFEVKTADSLQAAKELCETETFDVLVTDLNLPDGDGLEVKRVTSIPCCLALTGSSTGADLLRLKKAGFAEVLVKPVTAGNLAAAITAALQR